jgi:V/A-type H+-transporting ATPase subunit K
MEAFWDVYFLQTGFGWAILGAAAALMFGGMGSAGGIRTAAGQGAGVLSEKPELFGKVFPLIALPGTQGIYGFVYAFLVLSQIKFFDAIDVSPMAGVTIGIVGVCAGVVLWQSALYQGQASAASINLVAKKPDQFGRAIILPGMVEFYAMLAFLIALIFLLSLEWPAKAAAVASGAGG